MLRNPYAGKQISSPFICWECSAKQRSGHFPSRRLPLAAKPRPNTQTSSACGSSPKGARTLNTTGSIRYAELHSTSSFPTSERPPPLPNIRQRLREWDAENAATLSYAVPPEFSNTEGAILNNLTRTNDGDFRVEEDDNLEDEASSIVYDDLVEVGDKRGFLLPGDLVELRVVSQQAEELAIFIREVDSQSQFYTMSGKYINRSSQSALFVVPHFVEPKELIDIIPHLPAAVVPSALQGKLQELSRSVPREAGKVLLRKMLDFWAASDVEYQSHLTSLSKAHALVAHKYSYTYATVEEIAKKVLPRTVEEHPSHVLYAVHRSLFRDDIGFRPQIHGNLRVGGQYEISPLSEVTLVEHVRDLVRAHRRNKADGASDDKQYDVSELEKFAVTARSLIDLSRQGRPFTVYGTIIQGMDDTSKDNASNQLGATISLYSSYSKLFIDYLESWAALSSFGSSSSLNGVGSEILRAIQRYGDVNLDKTTAWTFLQEIHAIKPWENRLVFDLRLPNSGFVKQRRKYWVHGLRTPSRNGIVTDRLGNIRKNWAMLPVYCIDDHGAHEIDDGISIEEANAVGEYWIHVHAADPSSFLDVKSGIAESARGRVESIYMPERAFGMLPKTLVQTSFSLAKSRPCMTFSARMNKSGHILDTKIGPGRINKVLYLTPAVMQQVVLGSPSSNVSEATREVGEVAHENDNNVPEDPCDRTLLESHQLSDSHKADLQLLHEIGAAHSVLLRANGGIEQNFPQKPKLSASDGGWQTAPRIQISTTEDLTASGSQRNQNNLVQSFMLVAAQVAARWCNTRGIPVPYRVTPRNPSKEDPADFFKRKVLPSRAEHGVASMEVISDYLRLIGGVTPSLIAGRHAAVGVEMMTRCTSPLRRFTDLLVHWQIGYALLEEARQGQTLVGNTRDDFLPFSKADVEALLPHIGTQEKLIKHCQKEAERQWLCMFLLRAWQFKETELPSTMPFLIRRISIEERKIFGMLTDFSTRAQCIVSEEMDLADFQIGQILEVELEHINVYERKIQVKVV